jgi:hypothetical protein
MTRVSANLMTTLEMSAGAVIAPSTAAFIVRSSSQAAAVPCPCASQRRAVLYTALATRMHWWRVCKQGGVHARVCELRSQCRTLEHRTLSNVVLSMLHWSAVHA